MNNRRTIGYGALMLAFLLVISGCGSKSGGIVEDKINVMTTIYPIYEFTKEIGGDEVNVINLLPAGVEPHDWTPKSQDIVNTSKAQLFLYNGAGLEGWAPAFLKGLDKNTKVKPVEVSKGVKLISSEGDDGHGHGDEGEAEEQHDHHVDPHTWVSPKSALIMAENIRNSLVEIDPDHADRYEQRYAALKQKLEKLDESFSSQLSGLPKQEIVVSHQAFGYLARDYNLEQYAIMGLSPDAEPRAQDLVKLTKTVKEKGIRYIFFEELVSDKLAKTLASETGVETLVLNPVEGLTKEQEQKGDNYFTLMEKNLQNLTKALQ
ncbi:metal ABC transporter substrate-binding protein [Paenibacillus sp. N3/727]|uniref:metal ABC transporter substrate-binding protein n=1 Tax=Paenibacillus sp. N3/727 TaxID=2925845 RepID=UPI001F53BAAF|nr:metal ABC transporter substrate-binding protein [Paenibacillus sp. N3/727]UNK20370.1 metal ABC transporter substrate-binding protein [Paenibacillus sp. N3/727]